MSFSPIIKVKIVSFDLGCFFSKMECLFQTINEGINHSVASAHS